MPNVSSNPKSIARRSPMQILSSHLPNCWHSFLIKLTAAISFFTIYSTQIMPHACFFLWLSIMLRIKFSILQCLVTSYFVISHCSGPKAFHALPSDTCVTPSAVRRSLLICYLFKEDFPVSWPFYLNLNASIPVCHFTLLYIFWLLSLSHII